MKQYPISYSTNGNSIRATIGIDKKSVSGAAPPDGGDEENYEEQSLDEEYAVVALLQELTKRGYIYNIDTNSPPRWVYIEGGR
jgi:hypothetical protein